MNYTDTDGNPATGVVWSPGPLPGTVWVLPETGASSSRAVVVSYQRRYGTWRELRSADVQRLMQQRVLELKKPSGHTVPGFWAPLLADGIPDGEDAVYVAAHRQAFNDGRGMPAKDWHAALGFAPTERVQTFETNDEPTLLDLTA